MSTHKINTNHDRTSLCSFENWFWVYLPWNFLPFLGATLSVLHTFCHPCLGAVHFLPCKPGRVNFLPIFKNIWYPHRGYNIIFRTPVPRMFHSPVWNQLNVSYPGLAPAKYFVPRSKFTRPGMQSK